MTRASIRPAATTGTLLLTPAGRVGRKPRLMVAGEFSAGKTHLINGLLGDRVLPSNVTATALPPVWLVNGSKASIAVDLNGVARPIQSLDEVKVEDTHYCVLSHPAPLLERFDIIDTPGNSDPNIPSESWERMLDFADAVIWCTNATQAWRQSEKSVWNEMPDRLLTNATLLVTHADRMTDDRSAERVLRRVRREAEKYFQSFLMASLLKLDDLARIRDHLDKVIKGLHPLGGAPCKIVDEFAGPAAVRGQVMSDIVPVRPRRVTAEATAALSDDIEAPDEGAADVAKDSPGATESAVADIDQPAPLAAPEDRPTAEPATLEEGAPTAQPDQEWFEPASDEPADFGAAEDDLFDDSAMLASLAIDTSAPWIGAEEIADAEVEENHSAKVHILIPPAVEAEAEAGAAEHIKPIEGPANSARAVWRDLIRDVDLADAGAVLDCVERLLLALEGAGGPPEVNATECADEEDAAQELIHSLMSRRKP